jgi:hypothetical protein
MLESSFCIDTQNAYSGCINMYERNNLEAHRVHCLLAAFIRFSFCVSISLRNGQQHRGVKTEQIATGRVSCEEESSSGCYFSLLANHRLPADVSNETACKIKE